MTVFTHEAPASARVRGVRPRRVCAICQRVVRSNKTGHCVLCERGMATPHKVFTGRFRHRVTAEGYLMQLSRWGILDYEVVGDEKGWFVARVS